LRITFLGTGTSHGVPMIGCDCETCRSTDPRDKRRRPSVVDAGPDLRAQALDYDVRRIDALLFTHGHSDHILGLDELRRYNALQHRPMSCYADRQTIGDIKRMFAYVFDPATPRGGGLPQLELFTIAGAFCVGHQDVLPVPIFHGERPILGFRLGGFAYLTDCSRIPDESWNLLGDLDLLVLDALREKPHPTHFSLAEAVDAARRIRARRTCFTHMTHDLRHEPTCARLPETMQLAYDGLVLEISSREPRTANREP
jgi:phosphoribosyl 1,2-cyclic phosphate phosphodiesterase